MLMVSDTTVDYLNFIIILIYHSIISWHFKDNMLDTISKKLWYFLLTFLFVVMFDIQVCLSGLL